MFDENFDSEEGVILGLVVAAIVFGAVLLLLVLSYIIGPGPDAGTTIIIIFGGGIGLALTGGGLGALAGYSNSVSKANDRVNKFDK